MKNASDSVRNLKKGKKTIGTPVKPESRSLPDLWQLEEREAETRNASTDLDTFMSTCQDLQKIMAEIKYLKSNIAPGEADKVAQEINERRISGTLLFVTLKKLNRLDKLRGKKIRDSTSEARQKVDNFHLQLQNLQYEALHLQKEVTRCLEFKSKDEDIELVPVEEFYKEAPNEISKPDVTISNTHLQTLARLDWELEQRKRLGKRLHYSQQTKGKIAQEIGTKQEYLDNLAPRLQSILQSTRPLQDYLGMNIESDKLQFKMAHHLPSPLFILYVQLTAFRDACEKDLKVNINGEIEEAIAHVSTEEDQDDDSADSDQEAEDSRQKKQRHRRSVSERDITNKILQKFPLSVSLAVPAKNGNELTLEFYYLERLHVVSVVTKLAISSGSGVSDLLQPETVLSCLYPGDDGKTSPNPSNLYQLQKVGLDDISTYASQIGKPYNWAQLMAGLEFLPQDEGTSTSSCITARTSTSIQNMENIITTIRHRFVSRIALQGLVQELEKGIIPIQKEHQEKFPAKINTRLTSFAVSAWADVQYMPQVQKYVEEGLIAEECLVYKITAERGSAKVLAFILMSLDYPKTAPIFIVELLQNTSLNNSQIWLIEMELNHKYGDLVDEDNRNPLLANQIQRLLCCVDVFLEFKQEGESPREFSLDRTILRCYRGRDRRLPLRFSSRHGVWSQRLCDL